MYSSSKSCVVLLYHGILVTCLAWLISFSMSTPCFPMTWLYNDSFLHRAVASSSLFFPAFSKTHSCISCIHSCIYIYIYIYIVVIIPVGLCVTAAVGCTDVETPSNVWWKRDGDNATAGCRTPGGQSSQQRVWHSTCVGNTWMGDFPDNCPDVASTSAYTFAGQKRERAIILLYSLVHYVTNAILYRN